MHVPRKEWNKGSGAVAAERRVIGSSVARGNVRKGLMKVSLKIGF